MDEAFLSGNPANKEQIRLPRVNAIMLKRHNGIDLSILLEIDAVVDHMHPRRIDIEQTLDVTLGLAGNSNDGVCHFQRGLLNPKREIVSPGELLAFPWPERFQ